MYRRAETGGMSGNQLSFQNPLTNTHDGLCRIADVLGEGQHDLRRHWHDFEATAGRIGLVRIQAEAAMQLAKVVGCRCHAMRLRSMQSTGQGAMHSSQPVHSDSMTVCMSA